MNEEWFTTSNGLSYKAVKHQKGHLTISEVVFDRWNDTAKVRESIHVHWTEVFKWADSDLCGGLGLTKVVLSDGSTCFASGRYFRTGGLAKVNVGCYGSSWLERQAKV